MSEYITLAEAASTAGLKYNTLRAWLVDGLFQLSDDDKPGRTPAPHLIGPRSAGRVYRAATLIQAGVDARIAWQIAMGDADALRQLREALDADGPR